MPTHKHSITLRLSFIYTLIAFITVTVTGLVLYLILASSFNTDSKQFFQNELHVLNNILAQKPINIAELKQEMILEPEATNFHYYARLIDRFGHVILSTPNMNKIFPLDKFNNTNLAINQTKVNHQYYKLISQNVTDHNDWTIQLALNNNLKHYVLDRFFRFFIIILLVAVLVSVMMAYLGTKWGLRPLAKIAKVMNDIKVSKLNHHFQEDDWPQELKHTISSFNNMLYRLENSFNRLAQFSSNLAHEIRTPLNNILGEAEMMLTQERDNHEYQNTLISVQEEMEKLSRILDALLFLARTEDGNIEINVKKINLRQEVHHIAEYFEVLCDEKDIQLTIKGQASLNCDLQLIRRALTNLISNAIKYNKTQGKVTIELSEENSKVNIIIADTGFGIADNHLQNIFDRFYRIRDEKNINGVGLGLAIVKSIIELHGGQISVRSELNKGSCFCISLPTRQN